VLLSGKDKRDFDYRERREEGSPMAVREEASGNKGNF
jgi:hypothetical protein